jgi:small nuclear ribonucleoprotein
MAVKVLDESVGKVVLIKLKGGKVIRGNLQGFDQHMNLSSELTCYFFGLGPLS